MYTSGQIGLDPETGDLVPGGIGPQAEQGNVQNYTFIILKYVNDTVVRMLADIFTDYHSPRSGEGNIFSRASVCLFTGGPHYT